MLNALPAYFLILVAATCVTACAAADDSVPLFNPTDPATGWTFDNGREFPGATGDLSVDPDAGRNDQPTLRLTGDFTKGGGYVQAGRKLDALDVRELSMWVRNPDRDRFTLRINDGTGQTHQIDLRTEPGDQWQRVTLPLDRFFTRRGQADAVTNVAKYEYWGGAKDGKWHGPATAIYILLGGGDHKRHTLWLNDVRVLVQRPAYRASFEGVDKLPEGWTATGAAAVDHTVGYRGKSSLRLTRTVNDAATSSVTGPTFPITAGHWRANAACRSDLKSPDNSYAGVVRLELLDGAGKPVDRVPLADVFGRHDWQAVGKEFDAPVGAVSGRFVIDVNKAEGRFWVDEIAVTRLGNAAAQESAVARVLFSTARLGNLLFPNDPRKFDVIVETRRPLSDDERALTAVVRDYWGAEQSEPIALKLGEAKKQKDRWAYPASVELAGVPIEVGRYYELHLLAPKRGEGDVLDEHTSFAILPEAVTKQYKPEEVPFTSRNWDNRIPDYIRLTDRVGIRVCGLWGGWSAKPPYTAEAPGLDLCRELGMGWLTNTPAATIEGGKRDFDETALREGVRHLIEKYGSVRPLVINLGNEPHGTGDRVKANVAAYKVIYEEVKRVDPTITVVATSVEPNEEYFKLGYGQWCDAYDFHIYESAADVRRTIGEYHALMQKYGQVKPIWSTELGLNSQGMTRLTVAGEVTKKFTTFFAAGGTSCSWFGFLYPDPEGKVAGTSGDAHNVFDCRYSHYAPRLDAIAYYNAVNAIAIKKFVAEREYAGGLHAFLFRDRDKKTLQVMWKDKGRQDVAVPLVGVGQVQVIRVDGSRHTLDAASRDLTLTVSEDPLLLLYDGGAETLPEALAQPAATLDGPTAVSRRGAMTLRVKPTGVAAGQLECVAPPFWHVDRSEADGGVTFKITPAAGTAAHQADVTVSVLGDAGSRRGELYRRAPVGD